MRSALIAAPGFDLAAHLAALIGARAFAGYHLPREEGSTSTMAMA
jgi:hypothetical protein